MLKLLKNLGPIHFFTAGGLTTYAVLRSIKYIASRSSTVEKTLHKGFDVVEDKIDEIKNQVLPGEDETKTRADAGDERVAP